MMRNGYAQCAQECGQLDFYRCPKGRETVNGRRRGWIRPRARRLLLVALLQVSSLLAPQYGVHTFTRSSTIQCGQLCVRTGRELWRALWTELCTTQYRHVRARGTGKC